MNNAIQIRTVTVELLRAGPPHNQLLSPLTQYLGICGDTGAGIVTLPYEHATFLRKLKAMRYEGGDDKERAALLRDIGVDMARLLGSVPGLPGALTAHAGGPETLIHLRLTLSASELALLPYELAKVPIGPNGSDESWLALQTRLPVCVTRHSRNVPAEGNQWPARPRILFVAADPAEIPFTEHRAELLRAVGPFLYPGDENPAVSLDGRREQFGNTLTILRHARFEEVISECAEHEYTHVHLLAHGDVDPEAEYTAYGLVLHTADGTPEVIAGDRFACAFARIVGDRIHRPTVVTLATCDSGQGSSVLVPGASLAHALHLAGIPLVVASQFPLTKVGSVAVVRTLYQGLLWGANPWILLHRIRSDLHGRFAATSHDWASLVTYEALPNNLDAQLEAVRYHQSRVALNAALERVDQAVHTPESALADSGLHGRLADAIRAACEKLPLEGEFMVECLGLRASSWKRLAQAEFVMAQARATDTPAYRECLRRQCDYLEQSLGDYRQAARGFLVNEGHPLQRSAALHWVLTQVLSLSAVLGKPLHDGSWEAAKLSAEAYLDHASLNERAWALGSLAELWLLHLADCPPDQHGEFASQAQACANELVKLLRTGDSFPIESTRKQFVRYADWWGHPAFAQALADWSGGEQATWHEDGGLLATAHDIIALLERRRPMTQRPPALLDEPPPDLPPVLPPEEPPADDTLAETPPDPATEPVADDSALLGRVAAPAAKPFIRVEMLPAGHGDSLWLEYGEGKTVSRVLVDCGTEATYRELQRRVMQLPDKQRAFELFILSHIDADHIGGAIPFFNDSSLAVKFADVWFNGWQHLPQDRLGAKQGEIFSTLIQQYKLPWNQWRGGEAIVLAGEALPVCALPGGMRLTLLSPTPDKLAKLAKKWKAEIEDLGLTAGKASDFTQFLKGTRSTSTDVPKLADAPFKTDAAAPNGSSIAVLAEYQGKSLLLAADAHAPLLVESIQKLLRQRGAEKLKLDAFKVAHHASQNNLNIDLLKLLDCKNYLISTNGDYFNHPDREAIGRIIQYGGANPVLHFNFRSELNSVWENPDLQAQYHYQAVYPANGQAGLWVRL